MASIEQRPRRTGGTSYQIVWREDGKKLAETFTDKDYARRFYREVTAFGNRTPPGWTIGVSIYDDQLAEQIATRTVAAPPAPKAPTLLSVALEHFADDSRHTKAGPEHRLKMRRDFERHLGELGATPIDEVTREQFQEWLDEQAQDYAFKTLKTRRAAIGAVFRVRCQQHGGVNPVEGTRNDGKESEFEPVFLKVWEVEAIVEQLPTVQDRMYVQLLVGTGMRKGEALALRVADLDLSGPVPAVVVDKARKHNHAGGTERLVDGVIVGGHRIGKPKTRASRRTVRLDKVLAEHLQDFTAGRAPGEMLFDLGNEGTWQNNHWTPARQRAKLDKNPRIHDLRHTHASILLASGVPLFQVSKRLGHKDIQTTSNIYGHLDKSADVASADAFEAAMYPTGAPRKLRVVQ